MSNDSLKQYHKMVVDFWECFLSYSDPKDTDEWWKEFYESVNKLYVNHCKTDEKLARNLGAAFYGTVQRISLKNREIEA